MTPKQTLSHALESSQMIDEVLEKVTDRYYDQIGLLYAYSSPEAIKNALRAMAITCHKELNDGKNVLQEKYLAA